MDKTDLPFTVSLDESTKHLVFTFSSRDSIFINRLAYPSIQPYRDGVRVTIAGLSVDWTKDTSLGATSRDDFITKLSILATPVSVANGLVSTANSTSNESVAAGATWTGDWFHAVEYSELTITGTVTGPGILHFDLSHDGTTQILSTSRTHVGATFNVIVNTLVITTSYYRVRWESTSASASILNVQTVFHKNKSKDLTSTSSGSVSDITDVQIMRNISEPTLDWARGKDTAKRVVAKFGRNAAIGTTGEDIWIVGGNYNWLQSSDIIDVISNDANDDAAGLGARTVNVVGLNQNWEEVEEEVSLVGNGTATTTMQFIRVYRAYVNSVGTYHGGNYNDIDIQTNTGGIIVARIGGGNGGSAGTSDYGIGQSQLCVYTVPAGFSAYLTRFSAYIEAGTNSDLILLQHRNADTALGAGRRVVFYVSNVNREFKQEYSSIPAFPEKTDIWLRGKTASGSARVSAEFQLWLVKNK